MLARCRRRLRSPAVSDPLLAPPSEGREARPRQVLSVQPIGAFQGSSMHPCATSREAASRRGLTACMQRRRRGDEHGIADSCVSVQGFLHHALRNPRHVGRLCAGSVRAPQASSPLDSVAVWLGALRPRRPAAFSRATARVSQASADDGGAGRSSGSSPELCFGTGSGYGYGLG